MSKLAATKLTAAQKKILRFTKHIICKRCYRYSEEYSGEEIVFDIKLTFPHGLTRSYTEYCMRCYVNIYPSIASISHQKQRLDCLINVPHYWGVLPTYSGFHFAHKNGIGSKTKNLGDIFWYEFPNPDPKYYGSLVLAVVNLIDYDKDCVLNTYLDFMQRHTYYIFRDLTGYYRIANRLKVFYDSINIDDCKLKKCFCYYEKCPGGAFLNSARYRCTGYFSSLKEAINYLQAEHRFRFHYSGDCDCKMMSRYSNVEEGMHLIICRYSYIEKGKIVRNPWSLQALSAYFIKHYCYHNKREIYNLTHRYIRDIILTIDPIRSDKKWVNHVESDEED
jgi:hypothetical protein